MLVAGAFAPPPSVETPAIVEQAASATATATASPTPWVTIAGAPLRITTSEKAIAQGGRWTALVLREEVGTKRLLRAERLIVRVDDGTVPDAILLEVPSGLWGLRWSPDARSLCAHVRVSDHEGRLLVFDRETGASVDAGAAPLRDIAPEGGGFAHGIYFSPDSRALLVSCHPPAAAGAAVPSRPGALFLVDCASGEVRKRIEWE